MQIIIQVDKTDPLVNKIGLSEDRFYSWTDLVTDVVNQLQPTFGTGSPEGVVTAFAKQLYIDTDAAAGTGMYYKETDSGNTGWVARS